MRSSDSFYPDKHLPTTGRITAYEKRKRLEARKKLAIDIFRLNQRGVPPGTIKKRYNINGYAYFTLLRDGENHYNDIKIAKAKRR